MSNYSSNDNNQQGDEGKSVHQQGVKKLTRLISSAPTAAATASPNGMVDKFYCEICNVGAPNQDQIEIHLKGQRHQKRMKQFGLQPQFVTPAPLAKQDKMEVEPGRCVADGVKYLKCGFCRGYLSRGPVRTNIEGTINYCGRCITDDPDVNFRNLAYEHVAQNMAFPCTFRGCHKKVMWRDVKQHEIVCVYKEIICPMPNCLKVGPVKSLISHFNKCHVNQIIYHSLHINWHLNNQSDIFVGLLIHHQTPYILIIYNCKINMRVSLYSVFDVTDKTYRVCLYMLGGAEEHVVQAQNVTDYVTSSGQMTTVLNIHTLHSIFKSEIVGCSISLEMKESEDFNAGVSKKTKCSTCSIFVNNSACSRPVWRPRGNVVSVTKLTLADGEDILSFGTNTLEAARLIETTPAATAATSSNGTVGKFYCEICNVGAPSEEQIEIHFKGQRHQKKIKQVGPQPRFVAQLCWPSKPVYPSLPPAPIPQPCSRCQQFTHT